jgi:hypothetical protein
METPAVFRSILIYQQNINKQSQKLSLPSLIFNTDNASTCHTEKRMIKRDGREIDILALLADGDGRGGGPVTKMRGFLCYSFHEPWPSKILYYKVFNKYNCTSRLNKVMNYY